MLHEERGLDASMFSFETNDYRSNEEVLSFLQLSPVNLHILRVKGLPSAAGDFRIMFVLLWHLKKNPTLIELTYKQSPKITFRVSAYANLCMCTTKEHFKYVRAFTFFFFFFTNIVLSSGIKQLIGHLTNRVVL